MVWRGMGVYPLCAAGVYDVTDKGSQIKVIVHVLHTEDTVKTTKTCRKIDTKKKLKDDEKGLNNITLSK